MRKFILSLMFVVLASALSMASNNEKILISSQPNETIENTLKVVDDGFWQCVEMTRSQTTDGFSGETTVTITYRCWWITF